MYYKEGVKIAKKAVPKDVLAKIECIAKNEKIKKEQEGALKFKGSDYNNYTNAVLKGMLEERGLPTHGRKMFLVQRLEQDDERKRIYIQEKPKYGEIEENEIVIPYAPQADAVEVPIPKDIFKSYIAQPERKSPKKVKDAQRGWFSGKTDTDDVSVKAEPQTKEEERREEGYMSRLLSYFTTHRGEAFRDIPDRVTKDKKAKKRAKLTKEERDFLRSNVEAVRAKKKKQSDVTSLPLTTRDKDFILTTMIIMAGNYEPKDIVGNPKIFGAVTDILKRLAEPSSKLEKFLYRVAEASGFTRRTLKDASLESLKNNTSFLKFLELLFSIIPKFNDIVYNQNMKSLVILRPKMRTDGKRPNIPAGNQMESIAVPERVGFLDRYFRDEDDSKLRRKVKKDFGILSVIDASSPLSFSDIVNSLNLTPYDQILGRKGNVIYAQTQTAGSMFSDPEYPGNYTLIYNVDENEIVFDEFVGADVTKRIRAQRPVLKKVQPTATVAPASTAQRYSDFVMTFARYYPGIPLGEIKEAFYNRKGSIITDVRTIKRRFELKRHHHVTEDAIARFLTDRGYQVPSVLNQGPQGSRQGPTGPPQGPPRGPPQVQQYYQQPQVQQPVQQYYQQPIQQPQPQVQHTPVEQSKKKAGKKPVDTEYERSMNVVKAIHEGTGYHLGALQEALIDPATGELLDPDEAAENSLITEPPLELEPKDIIRYYKEYDPRKWLGPDEHECTICEKVVTQRGFKGKAENFKCYGCRKK